MNRRRVDALVALFVGVIVVGGALLAWQAVQQQRALDGMGSMMGGSMGAVHGTNPVWYVVGTLLVALVVGGGYVAVRDDLTVTAPARPSSVTGAVSPPLVDHADSDVAQEVEGDGASTSRTRVLDLLPEDERRVLQPVLDSPGITQIALRDRADFSKSKVSQTVSELEKRGLLYRERQGRTYRVYPSDDVRLEHPS